MESKSSRTDSIKVPHSLTGGSSDLILKLFLKHGLRPAGWRKLPTWGSLLLNSLTGVPFRWQERFSSRRAKALTTKPAPPLFVIGHWRSGTTHLHNLLTKDPQFGYLTMRHCITPNSFLTMPDFINRKLAAMMPDRRPVDGMKMGWDFPQEEEFALERMTDVSYNHCYLFPDRAKELFRRSVTFDQNPAAATKWSAEYHKLICRLSLDQEGKTLCLKNPPNTARIPQLLHLFPDAKFVFIVRNPEHVFRSTRNLWMNVTQLLGLTKTTEENIEQNFLSFYTALMQKYLADRDSIPAKNLVEVKFEDLENAPFETLQSIYSSLELDGFETAKPLFKEYIQEKSGFQKSAHQLDPAEIELVQNHWGFAAKEWGYSRET
ncbi:MAG: sulfotransferase [Planctomycetaceae bacterium]|nr:sulfotransferase [Planctomycetaceae bacterium]